MTLVNRNEKDEQQYSIELSTVYFYEGATPSVIALRDCGLQMNNPITGAFSSLHGYQSKQEGFMAARAYADRYRLQFTVIDFMVGLGKRQNPLMMKPESIADHEFVAFTRMTRSTTDRLGEIVQRRLIRDGHDLTGIDLSKTSQLISHRPELIAALLDEPGWDHLKVIVYPAILKMSEKPLSVATIPFKYWHAIQDATCRLNPAIQITLDTPIENNSAHTEGGPVPSERTRTRLK